MTYWTLEYAGVEKAFADWGFTAESAQLVRANMAPDVLTISAAQSTDHALSFAYGGAVKVRRNRTYAASTYSGGSLYFQGKATVPSRMGSAAQELIRYQFNGPWWDFERLVFQQTWKIWSGYVTPGDPTSGNTYTSASASELFLGQTALGATQNTGAQITEALNWAITCGASLQIGTIDPATNFPVYNARDMTVAEVIIQMVRWTPDVICWFDYTTSPPTFNARKLANLTNVTVQEADGVITSTELRPRYDLQLPAVHIRFKALNSVDGNDWIQIFEQKYPVGATGQELGASVHTVELTGSRMTHVSGSLECVAIGAQAATNALRVAWWQTKDPTLLSPKVDPSTIVIPSATVVDSNLSTVSLSTYPRELIKGSLASWMGFTGVPVTIRALITYDVYADDARKVLVQKGRIREFSARIMATDAVTGSYSAISTFEAGETVPTDLAQDIYNAHATLQYEGSLDIVASEVASSIGMGKKLTIQMAGATFSNLLIQRITERLATGQTSIDIGPASHLGLTDLIELLRVNRYRLIYNMPASQTGGSIGTGPVQLGKETQKENTTATDVALKLSGTTFDQGTGFSGGVYHDADSQKIEIHTIDNSTGARVDASGYVSISIPDLLALGVTNTAMKIRLLQFKDADTCSLMKMAIIGTAPEAA